MSVKAPPLILGEDTSSTPPSQNTPPLISVLKLLRKRNWAEAEVIRMGGVPRNLSLMPSWSVTNASLGAVSGLVVEVTHRMPLPEPPVVQPGGRAGATTPSKFSTNAGLPHGVAVGVAEGATVAVAVAVGVGVGVGGGVGVGHPSGLTVMTT